MLRELIMSVASGVIVALILGLFRMGARGSSGGSPSQVQNYYAAPRRRSFLGGVTRMVLAVIGGVALAQVAAAYFHIGFRRNDFSPRRFGYEFYDGLYFDPKMLILTVIGTILVWMFLLAITRR